MYTLENLVKHSNELQCEIDGKWVPARPLPAPFSWRLHDAWQVLTGKADAFTWPEEQ